MKKQRKGTIINISSIAEIIGSKNMSIYCSSKFTLERLSESLYQELNAFNTKVRLIKFGYVKDTNFGRNTFKKNLPRYSLDNSQKRKKETKIQEIIKIIKKDISENTNQLRFIPDLVSKKRISEKLKNPDRNDYLL